MEKVSKKGLIREMESEDVKVYAKGLTEKWGTCFFMYSRAQWDEMKACMEQYEQLTGNNLLKQLE